MDANYFSKLSLALSQAGLASPVLLVDKSLLDENIARLKETLEKGFAYRVVAKSLPSIPMLEYILSEANSSRLMCFHLPFLIHIAEHKWPVKPDLLLGKPMPVMALRAFYQWYEKQGEPLDFEPAEQVQWLIDSNERLNEYEAVALESGLKMKVNLEVDVGLHRGGFADMSEFRSCLERIKQSDLLSLSGLMGYDYHVAKALNILEGRAVVARAAKSSYQRFVNVVDEVFGSHEGLCLNAGGSPTYSLYQQGDFRNELAVSSALVKPSDFDIPTLEHHVPAAFIAAPILKVIEKPSLPIASSLSPFLRSAKLLPKKACFIYGGNWLADPCYPEGSERVKLYGCSSNQEMYSLAESSELKPNDYMFFRPRQSEALFLQFGQIAVYDQGKIVAWWSVFDTSKTPRWEQ